MNRTQTLARWWPFVFLLFCAAPVAAQQKCPAPPALTAASGRNIFTPQQEVDLGDIEAERVELYARVIHDDQLSAYLNRIVGRILAQLPPTQLQFRVTLIDLPEVNAFSLPGGRIYVARKLVAFARDDDEIADLLAHEMGHILSHQGAIDATRQLHEVLGVTSVGDRKDLADKYNRLLDNLARNPSEISRMRSEEEPQQYQADEVALYALADAGYSPASFLDFFDRLAQTKGKSGGWLTDLLGMTTPNEKRLREMRKNLNDLPAACRERSAATAPSEEFLAWQTNVIAYSGLGRKEVLPGLLDRKILDPPLRSDVTNLKFSPDGKYVLAQDDASIFVLSRDPLRLLFRADAPDSRPAQFTPDSQSVVFSTRGLRVEEWNVAEAERSSIHEMAVQGGCLQTLLSPDGKTLACVSQALDLTLYDVAQGSAIFTKKNYFEPGPEYNFAFFWELLMAIGQRSDFQWVRVGFSPDAKTFIAASLSASIAVDVAAGKQIPLHGALSDMVKGGFAFLDSDRVVAVNRNDIRNSAILKFPSGDVVERLPLGGDTLSGATRGDYVIVGPLKDFPVGVLDLSTNKFVFGMKDAYALDAYGSIVLTQARNGEITLFDRTTSQIVAHTALSLSPLGLLRADAVSADLKWVALSGDTRGAVWNAHTAQRVFYTRSFHGAYFDGDSALLADYPKLETQERSIGRLDLATHGISILEPIDEKAAVRQWGQFLVTSKPAGKTGGFQRDTILEVSDVHGGLLWTHRFPKEEPSMTFSASAGTLLLGWPADTDAAKDELKSDRALQSRLAAMHDRNHAWLLEELDARTGTEAGALVVDTGKGSFRIENAYAAGDWVAIVDSDSRTLVYSLSTGDQKAAFFGTASVISPAAQMMAIETEPGTVDIYGIPSFEKRGQLIFASPVALWRFSEDGKRFFVLTKDQTVHSFDPSRITLPGGTPANTTASLEPGAAPPNPATK
jgi:WD40 repeat protein